MSPEVRRAVVTVGPDGAHRIVFVGPPPPLARRTETPPAAPDASSAMASLVRHLFGARLVETQRRERSNPRHLAVTRVTVDNAALRRRREALGIGQLTLARAAGVSRSGLHRIETTGSQTTPRMLGRIEGALLRLEAQRERELGQ